MLERRVAVGGQFGVVVASRSLERYRGYREHLVLFYDSGTAEWCPEYVVVLR